MKRIGRIILYVTLTLLALLLLSVMAVNAVIVSDTRDDILHELPEESRYECIVVLGAGLRSDGTPSDMLRDRLDAAVSLYRRGASEYVLLTGDCSGEDYDEVSAMQKYCIERGVPAEALLCDGEGFSTYESIENTDDRGFTDVIVVTQTYHLHRAIYIAHRMGMEADGFSADYNTYRGQLLRDFREYAARFKDFLKVTF